jgi:hypothetical protein
MIVTLLLAIILFLPCCAVGFIPGGIDALAGTDFHEAFYDFVERGWNAAK